MAYLWDSLTETIQNKLPAKLADFDEPRPKEMYDWLKKEFGASSGQRQAELWGLVFSATTAENDDPELNLAEIRRAVAEIVASCPKDTTIAQFADNIAAYAGLRSLPASYRMLASTLYTGENTVTLDSVIRLAAHEHRERRVKGETVNEHGLLSANKANVGTGRRFSSKSGEKKKKMCSRHGLGKHDTATCWELHPEQMPEWAKEQRKREKGMKAAEEDNGSASEDEIGALASRIGEKVGLEAIELALASSTDPSAVILDSGATSPFIKDKHLLFDLSPLAKPVAIQVGNGKVVHATHTGTLAFRRVKYAHSYYVPEMSHNCQKRVSDRRRRTTTIA
jgi:hypothetical protein